MSKFAVSGVHARLAQGGFFVAMLLAACGGGGGGGDGGGGGGFSPAQPPSDICSLLAPADIQTILPGVGAGAEQQTPDTSSLGFWSRDCKWQVSATAGQSVELVIFGATTAQGLAGIKLAAQTGTVNTSVTGLGDEAHYWEQDTTDNGLWALRGSYSVDVTAYFFTPFPTEAQLQPLVAKALGEIK
jgi:hypothetical protein